MSQVSGTSTEIDVLYSYGVEGRKTSIVIIF